MNIGIKYDYEGYIYFLQLVYDFHAFFGLVFSVFSVFVTECLNFDVLEEKNQ